MLLNKETNLRGIVVDVLDCVSVVSGFELQLRHYVHVRTSILGIGILALIIPANSITAVLLGRF